MEYWCWRSIRGHLGSRVQIGGLWAELAADVFSLASLVLAHEVFLKFLN